MTAEELRTLRKSLDLTQEEMAARIGMSKRGYTAIEQSINPVRPVHWMAAERASLEIAIERGNPMLATPLVRRLALELARQINGA